jgi:hypothetical protein
MYNNLLLYLYGEKKTWKTIILFALKFNTNKNFFWLTEFGYQVTLFHGAGQGPRPAGSYIQP